jgi:CelD/BcsL family acetyltransferase involved in cellulose biosynthesis
MKPKKSDRIPLKLEGKGRDATMLYEQHYHRGKGSLRVTKTFKDLLLHYNKKSEHVLSDRTRRRMEQGGLRFAALGDKRCT